jgi:hypothetical protein
MNQAAVRGIVHDLAIVSGERVERTLAESDVAEPSRNPSSSSVAGQT